MKNPEKPIFNSLSAYEKQEVVLAMMESAPGQRIAENCQKCGACCLAYSIRRLKGVGSPCPNLEVKEGKFSCKDYENRPQACTIYDCRDEKTNTKNQRERVRELYSAKVVNENKLAESEIV